MLRVQFLPMPLLAYHKLSYLDIKIVDSRPDLIFRWEYPMTIFRPVDSFGVEVVNNHCLNVTKRWMDRVFEEVYGYSLEVNSGEAVEKPNLTNGFKDVRLVDLGEKKEGYFYQKRLNKDGEVKENRVVIMRYKPVYCTEKTKQVTSGDLMGKITSFKFVPPPEDVRIERFCRLIGLDYGELDMIDGKIIDVNPTPGDALFVNLPKEMSVKFVSDYNLLFKKYYA